MLIVNSSNRQHRMSYDLKYMFTCSFIWLNYRRGGYERVDLSKEGVWEG